MTASDLLSRIDAGTAPVVVDVRTRREFAQGHVPGAINHPLLSLLLYPADLPAAPDEPVVVYCGHGPRARVAAAMMRRAGFRGVDLLDGHMAGWREDGFREEP
jgi:rhodanese-related sulfurtransferase